MNYIIDRITDFIAHKMTNTGTTMNLFEAIEYFNTRARISGRVEIAVYGSIGIIVLIVLHKLIKAYKLAK